MNSVEKTASNAEEKPVHRTTRTKISHTWLASQTGPMAQSINSRGRLPRRSPPASRLQNPAPKSAPPNTAYIIAPVQSTIATTSAVLTRSPPPAPPVGARVRAVGGVLVGVVLGAPPPRHRPQRDDQGQPEHDVEPDDERERDPDPVRLGHGVLGSHDLVHDPRLAPHLRHDPAAFQRHDRGDTGDRDGPQEPARLGDVAAPPPHEAVPQPEQDEHAADTDHGVERQVQHGVGRRAVMRAGPSPAR